MFPRPISNYCPIVLEGEVVKKRKTPLKFENMWLKVDGFKDLIRELCTSYVVSGSSSHCLVVKLKALKKDLKVWNKEVFGNVSFNKAKSLRHISFWDFKERVSSLSNVEAEARRVALEKYKKWGFNGRKFLNTRI